MADNPMTPWRGYQLVSAAGERIGTVQGEENREWLVEVARDAGQSDRVATVEVREVEAAMPDVAREGGR